MESIKVSLLLNCPIYSGITVLDLSKCLMFSGYIKDHPCFNEENKKVIGKFKDELNGVPIEELIGLKAKMLLFYSSSGENTM